MGYYDDISSGYDNLHKEEQLEKLEIILENLDIKKTDRLLDVGCGTGFSLDYLGCDATGIEPSEGMVSISKNKSKIILGSAESLPFPDNTFDIVISITAIQNFSDIRKGLLEIKRVGKDRFALSVLKKSPKIEMIKKTIHELFDIKKEIEEKKDIIFIAC